MLQGEQAIRLQLVNRTCCPSWLLLYCFIHLLHLPLIAGPHLIFAAVLSLLIRAKAHIHIQ
jgi:hypothetical protein